MEKNNQKKEMTLDAIAELIKVSADSTTRVLEAKIEASKNETVKMLEAKIESSADKLAAMTQKQFLDLERKIGNVEIDVKEIKRTAANIEANLNKKVDKIDHNTLDYRVEKLEKKFA